MIAIAERRSTVQARPAHRWADSGTGSRSLRFTPHVSRFTSSKSDALDQLFATRYSLFASRQAAYDVANEQITFNSLPATFDANGNQTTSTDASGTTTYTWDARNRMVAQTGPGVSASFAYDALGRRVSKTINGMTTSYLYDGNDIVQEIGGSAVGASYVRSLSIDESFVRQTSTGNEFYHVDALGSTLDLTNQGGAVQTSYHYEAFGKTTITGTSSNPFQYTGREDDGTGLYYYRARYYSSSHQRFMSEDAIMAPLTPLYLGLCRINQTIWLLPAKIGLPRPDLPQDFNAYSYALNSAMTRRDPMGLDPKDPDQCGLGYLIVCATLIDDPYVSPYSGQKNESGQSIGSCILNSVGTYQGKTNQGATFPAPTANSATRLTRCLPPGAQTAQLPMACKNDQVAIACQKQDR